MKKTVSLIALLLAVVMILSLSACGKKNESAATAPGEPAAPAEAAPVELAPAEPAVVEAAPVETAPAESAVVETEVPAAASAEVAPIDRLTDGALAEGTLVVFASGEEKAVATACENFNAIYGINVEYHCLSADEVLKKLKEENGAPSGDVWFGAAGKSCDAAAAAGLLEAYEAINSSAAAEKGEGGTWYGIYGDIGAVAVLKGCAHADVAKLWVEFCLTPDCVAG